MRAIFVPVICTIWVVYPLPQTVHADSGSPDTSGNCRRYPEERLDTKNCPEQMRNNDHKDFDDLYHLMFNADQHEDVHDFLVYAIQWMYKYIHCASDLHAIAAIFYGMSLSHMPPPTSSWWTLASEILHPPESSAPMIGRRRKRSKPGDDALLVRMIMNIVHDTDPSCVQWLIDHFGGTAKEHFLRLHPNFPDPNNFVQAQPPVTAATTQRNPHHNHHTHGSKTTTTPITTTTLQISTSTKSTGVHGPVPINCWECQGLDCLIKTEKDIVHQCQEGFCMVTMLESAQNGRDIRRSCGSQASCVKEKNNKHQCESLEQHQLDWGTECNFCCTLDKCNAPPHIIPDIGRLKLVTDG